MEDVETTEVAMPSTEEIKNWKRNDVTKFLDNMKGVLDLDNEDIQIIAKQKVAGQAFLELATLDLERWGMAGGPAITITKLIKEIKGEDQGN